MKRYGQAETILSRHETWRKGFIYLAIGYPPMILTVIICLFMTFSAMEKAARQESLYFGMMPNGSLIPMVPLKEPFQSPSAVMNFAVTAVTESLTMNFNNWRAELNRASEYFTKPDGWRKFQATLKDSGLIDYIEKNKLLTNVVANGAVITNEQVNAAGQYEWTVEVKITRTYLSGSSSVPENRRVVLKVVRVPTWETPRGVAISQINIIN